MKTKYLHLFFISCLFLQAGCSVFDFLGSDDSEEKAASLINFAEEIAVRKKWNVKVGNGQGRRFRASREHGP